MAEGECVVNFMEPTTSRPSTFNWPEKDILQIATDGNLCTKAKWVGPLGVVPCPPSRCPQGN